MILNRIKMFIAVMLLCPVAMGCSLREDTKAETRESTDHTSSVSEDVIYPGSESGEININEYLEDGLYVRASMNVPSDTRFLSYNTKLKEFDVRETAQIFWPDVDISEIQVETYDEDVTMLGHKNEELDLSNGSLRYIRDSRANYIDTLLKYGEENKLVNTENLAFMTRQEMEDTAEEYLQQFGLGAELIIEKIYGADKKGLADIQDVMKSDVHYSSFFESEKLSEMTFDDEDAAYRVVCSFQLNTLPIFGRDDLEIQASGGIDRGLLAHPMELSLLYSSKGIHFVDMRGVLGELNESDGHDIIQYEGIKKSLIKKFGDVILTEQHTVEKMWLEYLPLIEEDSFVQIELIPVWCCQILEDEDSEPYQYALRFNAYTGEEIS